MASELKDRMSSEGFGVVTKEKTEKPEYIEEIIEKPGKQKDKEDGK